MNGSNGLRQLYERSRKNGHRLLKGVGALSLCAAALAVVITRNVAFASALNPPQPEPAPVEAAELLQEELPEAEPVREYALLCVDGQPYFAFATVAEASSAIASYVDQYAGEGVDSANLMESISVKMGVAEPWLLSAAEQFEDLAPVLFHVETVSHSHEEELLPFEVETVYDDTMYVDETVLEQAGRSGRRVTLFEEKAVNGLTLSRESVETVNVQPVNEIVRIGTKEHLSTGSYLWPAEGILTAPFGRRSVAVGSSFHKGIDVAAAYGTAIVASDGGTVIFSGWESGYGQLVKLQHENGDVTYYGHCSSLLVSEGDEVRQGEQIACMGATGVASGVHVHFEYRPLGGDPIDPQLVLPEL